MSSCGSCGSTENGLPKGCKNHGTCGSDGCNKLTVFDWLSDINDINTQNNKLVEVRFKNDRKGFFVNSTDKNVQIGDVVVVQAQSGHDVGIVTLTGALVDIQYKKKKRGNTDVLKIYRLASQKDIDTWQSVRLKENDVMIQSRKIVNNLNLSMKIADVEFQGDGTKATFYYTADDRVDFRMLIKEFASLFKCKIDMRQIGYRQESAKVGGIGSCGRELCCSSWLTDFRSVNTASARYQQLSINPTKIAGQCGKLKCCLNFELDSYLDAINDFPSQNTVLNTEKGKASCLKIDVFRKKMWFIYQDNSMKWYDFDVEQVKEFIAINKKGDLIPSLEEFETTEIDKGNFDIIEQNSLNRFEKRKPKQKPNRNRNQNRKASNSKLNQNKKVVKAGGKSPQESSNVKKTQKSRPNSMNKSNTNKPEGVSKKIIKKKPIKKNNKPKSE